MRSFAAVVVLLCACRCDEQPARDAGARAVPAVERVEPVTGAAPDAGIERHELTEDEQRAFVEHRRRGRAHAAAGEWEDAVRELAAAVAIAPRHAPTLGELGFCRFHEGELEQAELDTRRALRDVFEPHKRAPILYNLGRVLEERGQTPEALSAYRRSLELRPNGTVQRRYDALRAASPPPDRPVLDAVAGGSLGPFGDLDAVCEALLSRSEAHRQYEAFDSCESEELDTGTPELRAAGVFLGHAWSGEHYLALGNDDGWLVGEEPLGYVRESRIEAAHFELGPIEAVQLVEGGPPELLVRYTLGAAFADECEMTGDTARMVSMCGVSRGAPVCWGTLQLATVDYAGDNLLPTPMDSIGECDDHDRDPAGGGSAERAPSPELDVDVTGGMLVVEHLGGPSDPAVGRWTAAQVLCPLTATPPQVVCAAPAAGPVP